MGRGRVRIARERGFEKPAGLAVFALLRARRGGEERSLRLAGIGPQQLVEEGERAVEVAAAQQLPRPIERGG